ncbi:MAG: hypothetical protein ACR2RL_05090 [Gammaproteobacteria bacterium]
MPTVFGVTWKAGACSMWVSAFAYPVEQPAARTPVSLRDPGLRHHDVVM